MGLLLNNTSLFMWHEVIKSAENRCSIILDDNLEAYLISLLMRYSNKPEIAQFVFAEHYLQALKQRHAQRNASLQLVGDQCLLYAGLFPHQAEMRHVKITYFVDLGRIAYNTISNTTNDVFSALALEFVALMDVLQSIPEKPVLLPLEAYDQWGKLKSKRALQILQAYSKGLPINK